MQYKLIQCSTSGISDEIVNIGFITYENEKSKNVDIYLIENLETIKSILNIHLFENATLIKLINQKLINVARRHKKIPGVGIQTVGKNSFYLSNTKIVTKNVENPIDFLKSNVFSFLSLIQDINIKKTSIEV